jgi:hypothetical protein
MLAIVYLLVGFLPPLVAGPLAGMAFINILKRRKGWYQIPFWALLVVLNLLIMFWVVISSGEWFSVSSFSAFFATPAASIITVLVMRNAWRKLEAAGELGAVSKRWFTAGLVLIPGLQVGMFVALLIYGPLLCKVGLVVCQDL